MADPLLVAAVARQTARRERAEDEAERLARAAAAEAAEARRLRSELAHLRAKALGLARELVAAEALLREGLDPVTDHAGPALRAALAGRRVLYVGGRPSAQAAIGALVRRLGGDYRRHDAPVGEARRGLADAVAWADWVLFATECLDTDDAQALRQACLCQGRRLLPLRGSGVASVAAGLLAASAPGAAPPTTQGPDVQRRCA